MLVVHLHLSHHSWNKPGSCDLIDPSSHLHAALSVQEMQRTAKLSGGEGSLPTSCWEQSPSSSPGCYWLWGTLFYGQLVSARTPRPPSGTWGPSVHRPTWELIPLSSAGLCISLCIKLFLKGQNTQNKMLNLCVQFALGGWNVDCCILSPRQSSRWEIVSLNTATRKWIQMKWYIADDGCYFPLHWNCSMICGSL